MFSKNELTKMIWPEGARDVAKVTKRPPTAATNFRNSIITLVDKLQSKVRLTSMYCDVIVSDVSSVSVCVIVSCVNFMWLSRSHTMSAVSSPTKTSPPRCST